MTVLVSKDGPRCGTCEYWTGPREPRRWDVAFQTDGASGKCIGTWKGQTYMQHHCCPGWKKWGVLD